MTLTPRLSDTLKLQVLARDGDHCRMCGALAGDLDQRGRKLKLHLNRVIPRSHGGKDDMLNLRVLCSECHSGVRGWKPKPRRLPWILDQLCKASEGDQKRVMELLKEKFGE